VCPSAGGEGDEVFSPNGDISAQFSDERLLAEVI
jgi:hypothetical protein